MSDTQLQIPDDLADCKRVVRELCLPILIAGLVIMAIAWLSIEIRDQGREEGIRIGREQVIEELYPNSSE